jgi:hypothetical protein
MVHQDSLRHVERGKAILLIIGGFLHDIEPSRVPALDRTSKLQVKISGFEPNKDADTTYVVDGIPRVAAAEVEDTFPQAPMGMDAKETLTKSDKK